MILRMLLELHHGILCGLLVRMPRAHKLSPHIQGIRQPCAMSMQVHIAPLVITPEEARTEAMELLTL
jgi:hypothetical protein